MKAENVSVLQQRLLQPKPLTAFLIFAVLPFWRGGNIEVVWGFSAAILTIFAAWWLVSQRDLQRGALGILLTIATLIVALKVAAFVFNLFGCTPALAVDQVAPDARPLGLLPCSASLSSTMFSLSQTIAIMALFALGMLYGSRQNFTLALRAFLTAAVIFGIIGLLKMYGVGRVLGLSWLISSGDYTRFELGFVNPNTLSTYLSLAAIISLHGFILALNAWKTNHDFPDQKSQGINPPWGVGLLLLVFLLLLIGTQSRLGVATGILGLALLVIGQYFGARRTRTLFIAFALLGLVVLIGGTLQYDAFARELGELSTSIDIRIALYTQSVELSFKAPLFGHGAGTFGDIFPSHNHLAATSYEVWDKAHNTYLSLLVEQGMIGLLLHLAVFAVMLRVLFIAWMVAGVSVALLGICLIAVIALHSLGDFSMEIFGFAGTAMVLIGMIYRRSTDLRDEHFQ